MMCDFCHAVTVDAFVSLRFLSTTSLAWSIVSGRGALCASTFHFFLCTRLFCPVPLVPWQVSIRTHPIPPFLLPISSDFWQVQHSYSNVPHIRWPQHVSPSHQGSRSLSPQAMSLNLQARMRTWLIGGHAWIYYVFLNALDIGIPVSLLCYVLWMAHYTSSHVHWHF